VSSFAHLPIKPARQAVTRVGVLLRRELLQASTADDGHLVAYIRRHAPRRLIDALANSGREVRVYGLGPGPDQGRLRFRKVSERAFIHDLATGSALVTTAGNQVVGEALYLGKPVFALPEMGNFEQYINAHLLARTGGGVWRAMESVGDRDLEAFLSDLDRLRRNIDPSRVAGNRAALASIEALLPPRRSIAPEPTGLVSGPSAADLSPVLTHCAHRTG
jgi:uncharacterized protein (TIGR00661 family)